MLTEEQIAHYREEAKLRYEDNDIEFDEYPKVSSDTDAGGAWVAAWVWVDEPEEKAEVEDEEKTTDAWRNFQ